MRKTRKLTIAAGVMASMLVAGVAFAFWTANGTGHADATVGTDSGVTITASTVGNLYPGHSVEVDFTITNSSANTKVKIDNLVADTSGGNTNGISGLPAGCSASDFHFAGVSVNTEIAESGHYDGTGTLSFDDSGSNQDACKNATPVLHLKVDNSGIGGS